MKKKKRNFTDCEIEIMVGQIEKRKRILFGSLSSGMTNKTKQIEWQKVTDAVNSVSSEPRTLEEIKKKGLILKERKYIHLLLVSLNTLFT